MSSFYRFVLVVFALETCALIIIHFMCPLRGSPPLPVFTAADRTPCENPCIFGIWPGVTQAKNALLNPPENADAAHFDLLNNFTVVRNGDGQKESSLEIYVDPDGTVEFANFTVFDPSASNLKTPGPQAVQPGVLTLGDLISMYGAPDFVDLIRVREGLVAYSWRNIRLVAYAQLRFGATQPRISLNDRISNVGAYEHIKWDDKTRYLSSTNWRGFRSTAAYTTQAQTQEPFTFGSSTPTITMYCRVFGNERGRAYMWG